MALQLISSCNIFAEFEVCNMVSYFFQPILGTFLIVQNGLKSNIVLVQLFLIFWGRFQLCNFEVFKLMIIGLPVYAWTRRWFFPFPRCHDFGYSSKQYNDTHWSNMAAHWAEDFFDLHILAIFFLQFSQSQPDVILTLAKFSEAKIMLTLGQR